MKITVNDTISKISFPALCNWRETINIRVEQHPNVQLFNEDKSGSVVSGWDCRRQFHVTNSRKTFKNRFHFYASGHVLLKTKVNMTDGLCDV